MNSTIFQQPIDFLKHSIFGSKDRKTPKDIYFEKVAAESKESLRRDLTQLYEFGFTDFEKNLELL